MKIKVDYRERKILKLLESLKNMYNFEKITISCENLQLGDFIICDDDGIEKIILERKTLSDLASSIKDGRYAEQSFRLNNYNFHNHNIQYIIEGDLRYWEKYGGKYNKMKTKTFYVTMFSLFYYKGFSVMRTLNLTETAEYLLNVTDKMSRDTKISYYDTSGNKTTDIKDYCSVVNKVKKKNITPDNIGEIMLSQLPGISTTIAKVIINKFGSLYELIQEMDKNPKCLNDIKIDNRKIASKCRRSIFEYLLNKNTVIKVKTINEKET
jgi:ERCC4-type nuclease